MRIPRNCGREDKVGKAAIERLAGPLCGLLDPGRAAALRVPGLSYSGSGASGTCTGIVRSPCAMVRLVS
jgi:hypothetical protein